MDVNTLKKFEELWTTRKSEYRLDRLVGSFFTIGYVIVHVKDSIDFHLIISDDEVSEVVVEHMLAAGVPVRDIHTTRLGRLLDKVIAALRRRRPKNQSKF